MADTLLPDDPQTVQRLDSVACLLEWMRSMPAPTRKRFFGAIAECSDAIQQVVVRLIVVVKNPKTTPVERQRALMTIADALFPNADESGEYGLDVVTSEAGAAAENPSLARANGTSMHPNLDAGQTIMARGFLLILRDSFRQFR